MNSSTKAYLFDIDGTLVDSNDPHAESWVRALQDFNFKIPFSRVRPLIGMGGDKLLEVLAGLHHETSPGKQIAEKAVEYFKEIHLPRIRPFNKVRELFLHIKNSGCPIIIVTSADSSLVTSLLEIAGVADIVDGATSSEDVNATKPEPDLVLAAFQKVNFKKSEVKMVGDTRFDIEAAKKAGIETIAFRCGGSPEQDLTGAVQVFDGPEQFLQTLRH